jgi:hypothetical protein
MRSTPFVSHPARWRFHKPLVADTILRATVPQAFWLRGVGTRPAKYGPLALDRLEGELDQLRIFFPPPPDPQPPLVTWVCFIGQLERDCMYWTVCSRHG